MGHRIMGFQWKTKRDSSQGFVRNGPKSLYEERIGLRFSFFYRGLIGKDFGFFTLSNAFVDWVGVLKYHCYVPGIIFCHAKIGLRKQIKIAYKNLRFFQFRLNHYMKTVRDGSTNFEKGYWLNQISGYNPKTHETFLIALDEYSSLEPDHKSTNNECLKLVASTLD